MLLAKIVRYLSRRPSKEEEVALFTNQFDVYQKYSIGDYTYGMPVVKDWGEGATLRIGKYCSIAKGVTILLGGNHRVDWVTTYPFSAFDAAASAYLGHPSTNGDVVIGNDVWLGIEALVLSGITIGNGAVVAARAVVTKDVPPYAVVAGNPAKLIRFRFTTEQIAELEEIKWWEWPRARIEQEFGLLLSNRITEFIKRARQKQ